jgi:hypothetical protein
VVVIKKSRLCYESGSRQEEEFRRFRGEGLVSYRKVLQGANSWSDQMLFNHLAYAAMRKSDQGFVTLDQLLSLIEIGMRISVQRVAQYNLEEALVQQEPTRDAFVATVRQQVADTLQDCRGSLKARE